MRDAIIIILITAFIIWAILWVARNIEDAEFDNNYNSKHDTGDIK